MQDRRVLVADDDPDLARMLASLLTSWGHEPVVVRDGKAAMAALEAPSPPPRVLLDWMMPGMTGLDVLRHHRRAGGKAHVVMLTARDQKDDIVAGLEAGADDYVSKPFDLSELRARLFRAPKLTVAPPPDIVAGKVIASRYRLDHLLGQGGMGTVWRASHLELGHSVAIKLLLPAFVASPLARARFEAEARTASLLRSPYLVPVFDYGIDEGVPFLVMEHLHGRTLGEIVRASGPLALPVAGMIASQIARGLEVAHAAGVVHCDVKPENVFLEELADDSLVGLPYRAKLLDFGIARLVETAGERERSGGFVGTLGYASPEQLLGEAPAPATDVWALGATMTYAMTGRPPIPDGHPGAMMRATIAGALRPPTSLLPRLPPAVDRWAERACAVLPQERHPDVRTLARELRAIAATLPRASRVLAMSIAPEAPRESEAPPEPADVHEAPTRPEPAVVVGGAPRRPLARRAAIALALLALLALAWVALVGHV